MKKISSIAILLSFGFGFQVLAASPNSNQGTTKNQVDVQTQGNQAGKAVETQEKNKVMNQGENTQIQTQEQNAVQAQDNKTEKINNGNSSSGSSVQKRSQVATAVQAMLQIAERNSGIGQQVKVIAQNQNQNQVKLQQNIEKVQSRGGFMKFLVGPNYSEIKDAQKTLVQNRQEILQLNQIGTKLSNEGDQQQLAEQIKVLEQANLDIETSLADNQSGFSLFGWLNKLIS